MTHSKIGRLARFGSLVALPVALAGCSGQGSSESRDVRRVTLDTMGVSGVVASNDAFAWSLYGDVRATPGNLFFSPFSISAALAMTLRGARGRTADEMRAVLHVTDEPAYHTAFGALLGDLGGDHAGRGYELYVANALFGQTGTPFSDDFVLSTEALYSAPLRALDFGQTEAARATINGWVSDQTRGAIPALMEPGTLDPLTRLVLANAIFFDARWQTAFDPAETRPADFHLLNGDVRSVPMMRVNGAFRRLTTAGMSLVELPYQDDEVVLVGALPQSQTLDQMEAALPNAIGALADVEPAPLTVSLPKFALTERLPLTRALADLGMVTAFDERAADFSGMVSPDAGLPVLYVQDAVHQAHVSVDERGTQAAAATAVVVSTRGVAPSLTFDRPFVFLIVDRLTRSILFMGRLEDPPAP